jgi:hypothetical protein
MRHKINNGKDLAPEILAELRRILQTFCVQCIGPTEKIPKGQERDSARPHSTQAVDHPLESRGADIYLLASIGSWRDTMPQLGSAARPARLASEGTSILLQSRSMGACPPTLRQGFASISLGQPCPGEVAGFPV